MSRRPWIYPSGGTISPFVPVTVSINIAAMFIETVTGTNGLIVPPDGYIQGLRDICSRYGILLICDEVMCGLGRTGRWFAVDHWNVVPDMITMAKGLTSAYLPVGAGAVT